MSTLQKRSTAAAVLTALALALPASPALAAGGPARGTATAVEAPTAGSPTTGSPTVGTPEAKAPRAKAPKAKAPKAKAPRAKAPRVRKARAARLTVTGTVTTVEGSTLTLTVKSGTDRTLRGLPLEVTAAQSVRVVRNDETATLADLQVGDKVTVKATRGDSGVTATRVVARGVVTAPEEDAPETGTPETATPETGTPQVEAA